MASEYSKQMLWCHIREVKMLESFYTIHLQKSRLYSNIISGFLCITSLSAVATFFSNLPDWIWGFIVFFSSILSALNHLFPYNKRAEKIELLMPEFDELVNSVLHAWDMEENLSDEDIANALYKFRNERAKLESKYLGSEKLPKKRRIVEMAQAEADNYLKYTLLSSYDFGGIENGRAETGANSDPKSSK